MCMLKLISGVVTNHHTFIVLYFTLWQLGQIQVISGAGTI